MTTTTEAGLVGGKIRALRREKGMSLADVAFEIRLRHGRKVTGENLRLYEIGRYDIGPLLFAELADVLDFSPAEVSPDLAEDLDHLGELLRKIRIGNRWFGTSPDRNEDWNPYEDAPGPSIRELLRAAAGHVYFSSSLSAA